MKSSLRKLRGFALQRHKQSALLRCFMQPNLRDDDQVQSSDIISSCVNPQAPREEKKTNGEQVVAHMGEKKALLPHRMAMAGSGEISPACALRSQGVAGTAHNPKAKAGRRSPSTSLPAHLEPCSPRTRARTGAGAVHGETDRERAHRAPRARAAGAATCRCRRDQGWHGETGGWTVDRKVQLTSRLCLPLCQCVLLVCTVAHGCCSRACFHGGMGAAGARAEQADGDGTFAGVSRSPRHGDDTIDRMNGSGGVRACGRQRGVAV
ncbi:hypothetical protein ABZP36_023439 [Zizania latifolia]